MAGFVRPGRRVHWREPAELPQGKDFLAPSGHPRHERSAKGWAKLEPAAALLSCYALVQSDERHPSVPSDQAFSDGTPKTTVLGVLPASGYIAALRHAARGCGHRSRGRRPGAVRQLRRRKVRDGHSAIFGRPMSAHRYFTPVAGLPPQQALLTDRAVITEAYTIIPRGVLRDIVTSRFPALAGHSRVGAVASGRGIRDDVFPVNRRARPGRRQRAARAGRPRRMRAVRHGRRIAAHAR